MLKILNILIITVAFSSLFSCVANRKYQEEVEARSAAQRGERDAKAQALETKEQLEAAQQEIKNVEKELRTIETDYNLVKSRYEQQQRLNKDLQASYDKLLELNEKLTAQAAGKRRELSEEVARKEAELRRKEEELQRREREMKALQAKMDAERAEINRLQTDLEAKTANISNLQGDKTALQKDLEAREARVKELEAAIAARDAKANALRDKLKEALLGFESDDLSVEMRNGKVYVSLSQNLLFTSGSSKLDSKGADALTKLANVLKKNKGINVLVEGHTDSDGEAKMNWELSTKRSLSIVSLLTKNEVAPGRITAAGRGEFAPIASNDTDEGKARNRRTDIILSPQLDEIMDILKK
ncbi:MAG: OmpA family protein [Aureispira sp.]